MQPKQQTIEAVQPDADRPVYAISERLAGILFWCLLAVVVVAPLPFASVDMWAWGPLAVITAVLAAVGALTFAGAPTEALAMVRRGVVPLVLFIIPVIWIVVQSSSITPSDWHHPIWREARSVLPTIGSGSISVDANRTLTGLARLLWYASVFWLAFYLGRDRRRARIGLYAIAIAGVVYAVYGLVVELGDIQSVLWVKKTAYVDSLTSTFVNKNSYAAYAGLGLITLTAIFIKRGLEWPQAGGVTFGDRLTALLSLLLAKGWLLILAWILVLTALILANSRAGLVASLVGMLALLIALAMSKVVSSRLTRRVGAGALIAAFVLLATSGDLVSDRFTYASDEAKSRIAIYKVSLQALNDAPVLGMGYGTYEHVFQLYRRDVPELRAPARQAHNTYLENAIELGIPAAVLLTLSVVWFAVLCFFGTRRRRRDIIYPAVGFAASVHLGLHSVIDFSLQIPAVTITYLLILGIGAAQSWSTRKKSRDGVKVE